MIVLINYYFLAKIWDLEIVGKEMMTFWISLLICPETRFCCLFSVTRKIIGMSSLLIHMKCLVDIYFIEKQIFAKQPFLNYGSSKMAFHFFMFFTFSYFRGTFVKNFMKKLSVFNANFWNLIHNLVFCQVLPSQSFDC